MLYIVKSTIISLDYARCYVSSQLNVDSIKVLFSWYIYRQGDQILYVNGDSLTNVNLNDAFQSFATLAPGPIHLIIINKEV